MTKSKLRPPWWQLPAIIAASVTALGVLGTGIIKLSRYLTLPERVEASEQKNTEQDTAITTLTTINDTWQKIYQQQQAAPRVREEDGEVVVYDDGTQLWCLDPVTDRRWKFSPKRRCRDE